MASFALQVNGQSRIVDADAATPLLYVLRQDLNLKGTRFGCGSGHCGACTVLIDGQAIQSCDIAVSAVTGSHIDTIESAQGDYPSNATRTARILSIVRESFLELQAAQCGYCINGIMMSVCATLLHEQSPDRDALTRGLTRHLCRCGTHHRILRAALLSVDRARSAGLIT